MLKTVHAQTAPQEPIALLVLLRVPAVQPILSLTRVPAHAATVPKGLYHLLAQLNAPKIAMLVVLLSTVSAYPAFQVPLARVLALRPVVNVPRTHILVLARARVLHVNQDMDATE